MKRILLLLVFAQQFAFGQAGERMTLQLDSLMEAYVSNRQFSGVVLVAREQKILFEKAFGYADREQQIPNTTKTRFNIASVGKTLTATLIMQLVEEKKLELSQTLQELLPEYSIMQAEKITVRHLLTHTSGVGNYMMHARYEADRHQLKSLRALMPYVTDMEPTLETPGDHFDYSNSGFIILGRIIEKVTGKSYLENLRERIFQPARMRRSQFQYPPSFSAPAEAKPYYVFTEKTFVNATAEEFPPFSDGGMQTSAGDLHRFALGLLRGKLLNPALRDSMWTGQVAMGRGAPVRYGFGWIDQSGLQGKPVYGHDGGGKGFSTDFQIIPQDGYIIVVLINSRINPREVSGNILQILYEGAFKRPEKPLENQLMEVVETKGFDHVRNNYRRLLADRGFEQTPNPWVYIQFSMMFQQLQDIDKALAVCEMGRQEFPESAMLYSHTGNVLLEAGKPEAAKPWFVKALEIDPEQGFAQMMLRKINDSQ